MPLSILYRARFVFVMLCEKFDCVPPEIDKTNKKIIKVSILHCFIAIKFIVDFADEQSSNFCLTDICGLYLEYLLW